MITESCLGNDQTTRNQLNLTSQTSILQLTVLVIFLIILCLINRHSCYNTACLKEETSLGGFPLPHTLDKTLNYISQFCLHTRIRFLVSVTHYNNIIITLHACARVASSPSSSQFFNVSACNIEKVGGTWGQG